MGQIYVCTFNIESPFAHIRRVLVGGSPEDHMVSPVKETLNQHLLRPRTCDAQHSLIGGTHTQDNTSSNSTESTPNNQSLNEAMNSCFIHISSIIYIEMSPFSSKQPQPVHQCGLNQGKHKVQPQVSISPSAIKLKTSIFYSIKKQYTVLNNLQLAGTSEKQD